MNKRSLGVLAAVNIALLVGLWVVGYTVRTANAQLGGRGDYAMIAGQATGSADLAVVYVLELRSQSLVALTFDTRTNKLQVIDTRQIANDLITGGAR